MATKIRSKKNTMKNTGGMPQWQGLAAPKNVQTKLLKLLTLIITKI